MRGERAAVERARELAAADDDEPLDGRRAPSASAVGRAAVATEARASPATRIQSLERQQSRGSRAKEPREEDQQQQQQLASGTAKNVQRRQQPAAAAAAAAAPAPTSPSSRLLPAAASAAAAAAAAANSPRMHQQQQHQPFRDTGSLNRPVMRVNPSKMCTPIEERLEQNLKVRIGLVAVSDGKIKPIPTRLYLTMEVMKLQREEIETTNHNKIPADTKERMVQITRQKVGGLGLSIKGGAEHKLPVLISRIYKSQAADQTGQLFVGDAIIKVNGEYITACNHDDAVNILRNAGDIVVLTVKHYRAAKPFLQKTEKEEKLDNASASNGTAEEGWISPSKLHPSSPKGTHSRQGSNTSTSSIKQKKWVDIVTVPLMMAYVTRYIFGTDKLRRNAFEVRGLNGARSGVIHCDDTAILSQWLKYISDNITSLTYLQMKLYNRNFGVGERIEYMGWVNEAVSNSNQLWQSYRPRFLALKGPDLLLFETPPCNIGDWSRCALTFKVYQILFRVMRESENVDERQHCFLVQSPGKSPRYLSVETRQELLRIEAAWHTAVCSAITHLKSKTFPVIIAGKPAGLTLDLSQGFTLTFEGSTDPVWRYKFYQLRGSSDDGKSKLKLLFQEHDSIAIETKELESPQLQNLLFCIYAFITARVAVVDPTFLRSAAP